MARKLDSRDDQQPQTHYTTESSSTGEDRSVLNRRTYMKLGAAAISALSLETVTGSLTNHVSRHGIEFRRSQDAIDDLGMDPTGEESIDGALERTADGDLIQFPDGIYRFHGAFEISTQDGTRGFEGVGENVTFLTSEGDVGFLLDANQMDGVYVSNIAFDQRLTNSCIGIRLTGDRVICKDVELIGGCDCPGGGVPLLSHATESATGQSLVVNIVASAGCNSQPALGRPGIFLEQSHKGTLMVQDCDLRQFPSAAVHATRHSGRIRVIDSYFENNASAIRLSGPGSRIKDSKIVVDDFPSSVEKSTVDSPFRLHGIAVGDRNNESASTDPLAVSNSTIRIENAPGDLPAVVTPSLGTPVKLADCKLVFDETGQSVICARSPGPHRDRSVGPLSLRDSVVRGNGTVDSIIVAENADGITITNSSLQLAGGDGITIRESDHCNIEQTNINVPGRAGVFTDSGVDAFAISPSQPFDPEYSPELRTPGPDQVTIETVDPPTWYDITVDGRFTSHSVDTTGRSVLGENREGVLASDPVTYTIDGQITDFRLGDGGRVYFDGNHVDKNSLGNGYPHRLTVDGRDTDTAHAFTADTLSPKTPRTGETNQVHIDETDAVDEYRFAGALEALALEGTATLSFSRSDPEPTG